VRGNAAILSAAKSRLRAGKRVGVPLVRAGTPQMTAMQKRMQDPANYRDLSSVVRHLTYHMFPMNNAEESWIWNLQQLADRWGLFNGKRVLGLNVDKNTASLDEVLGVCEDMGIQWDRVVQRPNDPGLGEVLTWVPSLEYLNPETAQPNEVVFSAHAKGVKYGGCPPLIREWADVMYQACLESWETVRQELSWCLATGPFRARYAKSSACRNGWYYSGAFWWWRLHDIGQRDWRNTSQQYPGRELWIGNQATREETSCLFMDNTRSPYDPDYWDRRIRPNWLNRKKGHASSGI